jgi:8-oxo-dGTP diphosphatase
MIDPEKESHRGCSILFINDHMEVLLLLRDDIPTIPYPGMWDIPGGHVEPNETPSACIVREMKEEMGIDLTGHRLFARTEFSDRIEYTFWKCANLDLDCIHLTEGQRLGWFSKPRAHSIRLAYGFNWIIDRFFNERPFEMK